MSPESVRYSKLSKVLGRTMVEDGMAKDVSTDGDNSFGQPSGTAPVPGSPSPFPTRRKRSNPAGQKNDQGRLTLVKRGKFEKETILHVLLPNETAFKFHTDAARIHSLDVLVKQVKENALSRQLDLGTRPVEFGAEIKLDDVLGTELNSQTMGTMLNGAKIGSEIKLMVKDGHSGTSYRDRGMWDLTPKVEMLGNIPQGYTLETALADHIDNALQAVWNMEEGCQRRVSVHLSSHKICILDNGKGMDGSKEHSLAHWGTVGGSTHRAVHHKASGGKPPYLQPYFGKYGAGAVGAAFHLGKKVTVFSKTKESKWVASLVFDPKELLKRGNEEDQQGRWKSCLGKFRPMTNEEREFSPHGSFTRVEITELNQQYRVVENDDSKVGNVRQLLKDIYFPYIQFEELEAEASSSKTVCPVQFEVNGTCLATVTECETAISNLESCNGAPFVFNVHLARKVDVDAEGFESTSKNQAPVIIEEANAQVTCQYYPNKKGQEALEVVAEKLKSLRPSGSMTVENMSRVTVRWLGKLLPEVKWPPFPFMEPSGKKSWQQRSVRSLTRRVRTKVDTDAGFRPVASKTDLERDQQFVIALKELGSESLERTSASGVKVSIEHQGKDINLSRLAELYLKWLKEMHREYDEEFVFPYLAKAEYIFQQGNCLKDLGMGDSEGIMLHRHMKDAKHDWKISDSNPLHFKLCKGPGVKADKYVTLEYFYYDAAEGEGSQVNFICRAIEVDASEGCQITTADDSTRILKLNGSGWFPATVLSNAKSVDLPTWRKKEEEYSNKAPGSIEVLNGEECKKLDVPKAFPDNMSRFEAGYSLPKNFPVVVRPRKASGGTKQGLIVPESMVVQLVVRHCSCPSVKFCTKRGASASSGRGGKSLPHSEDDHSRVVRTIKAKSTTKNGVKGLYFFNTESSEVPRLTKQGTYTFRFELESEKYTDVVPAVSAIAICPSKVTASWTFCNHPDRCIITDHVKTEDGQRTFVVRLEEPVKEDLFFQKYDRFGNSQAFEAPMENLEIVGVTLKGQSLGMHTKVPSSTVDTKNKNRLHVKVWKIPKTKDLQDIIFAKGSLKELGSSQEALLRVVLSDSDQQPEIKCKVFPGPLAYVKVIDSEPEILLHLMHFGDLQPGEVIRKLTLQGLDESRNKVEKGRKLCVILEGAEFQDKCGDDRLVDEDGTVQLGGLVRVTDKYNSPGSITLRSGHGELVCTIDFCTFQRRLVAERVPAEAYVGSQLEGISIKMVDKNGTVDTSVNAVNQTITADWEPDVTFRLINGECILPRIQMPERTGSWKGLVSFSADPLVCVKLAVKLKLGTACTLGPTVLEDKGILAAECGVPLHFPFKVYDDNHKPALLEKSITARFEAKELASGGDSESVLRIIPVEIMDPDKDFQMSLVGGIPVYRARIVVSGPVGTYVLTMTDTSLALREKAELICNLQHGPIAQLLLERSDGTIFQYEGSDDAACPIIGLKRRSPNNPELTVKLLDSHGNVCTSTTEERTLRVTVLDCPWWKELITSGIRGVGKFKFPFGDVPIGRYRVLIELGRSVEELYSLEEEKGPVQVQVWLRVDHGNYPSSFRLDNSDPVTVPLTDVQHDVQHVPPMIVLIDSADGLRLQSAPSVRVRIFGDSFEASGPEEYLGVRIPDETMVDHSSSESSHATRFELAQVRVPSQAGTYRMDFILDGDVPDDLPPFSRSLIVCHGRPKKIQISQRADGQEILAVKLTIVDAHGNHCESASGLVLHLDLTLTRAFSSSPGLGPCVVLGGRTALVEEGNGDFGVLQLTQGLPGLYSLKVSSVQSGGGNARSLIPAEAQVFVVKGDINQSRLQLSNQHGNRQVMDDVSKKLARCERDIQLKKTELATFETKKKGLEVELVHKGRGRQVLMELQRTCQDTEILTQQKRQPRRNLKSVFEDMKRGTGYNKQAAIAFWGAMAEGIHFGQPARDFLGFVVTLAQVEDDSLSRMLAEFLTPKTLTLIITRTQSAVDALEVITNGQINRSVGLHGYARARGYTIPDTVFKVLALSDLQLDTNYNSRTRVITNHSQRILDMAPPLLPSGQIPNGFLGYAVNLLYLTPDVLQMRIDTKTQRGVGLRESLFFSLFRSLQVYDTKENMIFAKGHVKARFGGAVSLDGRMIRADQRQELGRSLDNNTAALRFGLVPYEERRNLEGLMPPARESFRRLKELASIESDITRIEGELGPLGPAIEEITFQIPKLNRNRQKYEGQKQEAQEAFKEYQEQIIEVQRATNVVAARNAGTTGQDQPGGSESTDKMRAFLV